MTSCLRLGSYCTTFIILIAILFQLWLQYGDQREYNRNTTAEISAANMDLTNKIIIVTGANTGIGKPTARVLLSHGATVIMACRNKKKAQTAKADIIYELINNNFMNFTQSQLSENIDILLVDLGSLQSIKTFAAQFKNKYNKLNYLILNAGIAAHVEWEATVDGIESVFGVNHVGHFYLTQLLTDLLIQTAATSNIISRVISVSSKGHARSPQPIYPYLVSEEMIENKSLYTMWYSYGLSKAANILFAKEFNDRYYDKNVYAVSLHPGGIATQLVKQFCDNFNPIIGKIVRFLAPYSDYFPLKTVSQGAATTIRTVSITDDEFSKYGGSYFVDCNVANDQLRSDMKNKTHQVMMWELTEIILKEKIKT